MKFNDLTRLQKITIAWWWVFDRAMYDLYTEGIIMGMTQKFAFKRAVKLGD